MKPIKKNRPPTYTEAGYKRRLKKAHVDRDEAIACANEADRVVRVKDATIESLQKQITHWQTRCNGLAAMVEDRDRAIEAFQRSENSYSAQVKKLAVQASDGQIRHKALIGEIESLVEQRDQRDAELAQFREANAGWVERDEKHVAEIQRLEDQLTSARGLAKDRLERMQQYDLESRASEQFAKQQRDALTRSQQDQDELSRQLRESEAARAAQRAEIVQLTRKCDNNTGIRWTAEDYALLEDALSIASKFMYDMLGVIVKTESGSKLYEKIYDRRHRFQIMLANIDKASVK